MRKKYVFRDGKFIEIDKERPRDSHYIITDEMPDMVNHADGKVYNSKSEFRKATRRAGCYEVGNDYVKASKPQENREEKRRQIAKVLGDYGI